MCDRIHLIKSTLNTLKRKVYLECLLQRASVAEKKQRILNRKWPWSSAIEY